MVDAAASWAVGTLRDITIEEVKFLYGVKDKVVDLERDLRRMRDFLEDADKWPERYDSAIVRRRVSDFIDLATRAEDVLEEYAVEVTSKRGERNLLERVACKLCDCWDIHKIGKEIEGIMSRVAKLTEDLRQIYDPEIEEHFVGMEKDINSLVSLIMENDDRSSRVISICGMGGLGKTTLARKIYHHKDVLSCFEARAWVCITQKLQARAIFPEILRQLLPGENNEQVKRMEETYELVKELYDIQKQKKCLVVFDDIWEIDHWNILKNAFPLAESKSKILLTTRNQRVADTAGFVYNLGFLTEDESWDLFRKIALPIHQSEANSKEFEAIGREVVRKCAGLPLAVSVIGGILRGQQNLGDWKKVLENMDIGEGSSSFEYLDDQRLLRRTYGHEIEEHFVGMEKDINSLVSLIMKNMDDRSSRVISICGMGGLGKTTLARKIYEHKDVLSCFEARAWVCITQKLQAKAIFQEILRQLLPGENNEGKTIEFMVTKLFNVIKEKKCLVVVDDIWETHHWNILKIALPLAESNSKILLTTRNKRVAETELVYELDYLTEDESWNLLKKIALPIQMQSEAYSKQFEATGRRLLRKCGCLPLAVSVVGGILRGQPNLGDWKKVLQNMDSYLKHRKGVDANDKRVEQVLNLSYNVLPYYLKLCFLYLGCFPEDEDIEVESVYLIWIAEGLISSDHQGRNETLWDVAERYLNELASKCIVQVKMSTEGFKSCRLHDLVRDLCLSKGKEENFFEDSQGKIRRLAINLGDTDACSVVQLKNANLLSLLLLSNRRRDSNDFTNIWQDLLNNALLRSLKVLVLEHCKFEDDKLPHDVRKLVMLKHLSIRYSHVREVPEFVCKLPCLQSLDLRSAIDITLPNLIGKMGRLRHLFLNPRGTTAIDCGRLRLEGLTELETLIGFSSELFDTTHLLKLTNLQRLDGDIYDIESLSVVVDHMIKLKDQLREVSLEVNVWDDLSSEQGSLLVDRLMHCPLNHLLINGKLRRLPTWDPQLLQNLVSLSLFRSEIVEDPMETLQRLPTLQSLSLGSDAFVGTEMVCGSKGFPQLKSLSLWGLMNLVGWRVEEEAMPNLSELLINKCPKLEMIPKGLISIASITKLSIYEMPSNFMERLKIGGEVYPKISHIPFLRLF